MVAFFMTWLRKVSDFEDVMKGLRPSLPIINSVNRLWFQNIYYRIINFGNCYNSTIFNIIGSTGINIMRSFGNDSCSNRIQMNIIQFRPKEFFWKNFFGMISIFPKLIFFISAMAFASKFKTFQHPISPTFWLSFYFIQNGICCKFLEIPNQIG